MLARKYSYCEESCVEAGSNLYKGGALGGFWAPPKVVSADIGAVRESVPDR